MRTFVQAHPLRHPEEPAPAGVSKDALAAKRWRGGGLTTNIPPKNPLIPANAGTQIQPLSFMIVRGTLRLTIWAPAFAGVSGRGSFWKRMTKPRLPIGRAGRIDFRLHAPQPPKIIQDYRATARQLRNTVACARSPDPR